MAPGAPPFSRMAIPMATNGGNLRSSESAVTLTVTGFLVARSVMVTVLFAASVETTVPAMSRNAPVMMACAVNSVPSSFLVPRARSWLPGLIWSRVPGLASSNLTESGA